MKDKLKASRHDLMVRLTTSQVIRDGNPKNPNDISKDDGRKSPRASKNTCNSPVQYTIEQGSPMKHNTKMDDLNVSDSSVEVDDPPPNEKSSIYCFISPYEPLT